MALQPDTPFPKKQGDNIRSKDWNDAVNEIIRLDAAKLNLAGGQINGALNVSGKLGIGTNAPTQPLTIQSAVGTYLNLKGENGAYEVLVGADSGGGIVSTMTNHDLQLRAGSNSTKMIIKANGNVGINETNPASARLIVGGVTSWNTGLGLTGNSAGGVGLFVENTAPGGRKYALFSGGTGTTVGVGGFGLYDDTANAYRLAIDTSGNLGVGVTDPGFRLDVAGRIRLREGGGSAGLWLYRAGAAPLDRAFIGLASDNSVGFWGNNGASWGLIMETNTGNVGIGVANPGQKLEVNGTLRILTGTNPLLFTSTWTASPDSVTDRAEICNDTTAHKLLMIVGNRATGGPRRVGIWDQLFVANAMVTGSDARRKEDITPLKDSLASVLALRGVRFKWRTTRENEPQSIGLIAQEVEEVFPELVETGADDMKAINYPGLIAPLIEAVKQQHREISELRDELQSLKTDRRAVAVESEDMNR
ncbi:MAG TPA: tail fiber domain-containing protein [Pyrinomonadaceae bacterium]|jgi:hypothetical protein